MPVSVSDFLNDINMDRRRCRTRGVKDNTTRIIKMGKCPKCDTVKLLGVSVACDAPYAITCDCGRHFITANDLTFTEAQNSRRISMVNRWNTSVYSGLPVYVENQ